MNHAENRTVVLRDQDRVCRTIDGTTQLPPHHVILEQGAMKFPPWRLGLDSAPCEYRVDRGSFDKEEVLTSLLGKP